MGGKGTRPYSVLQEHLNEVKEGRRQNFPDFCVSDDSEHGRKHRINRRSVASWGVWNTFRHITL
ncbi:hypothetical protein WG66_009538 [Moniliophthora roreri]|nr:hypothetical protein WG66_009538 [Moniliophthora roreri]